MKEVVDRIVQYPNRYKLTDAETGQELGTYDFTEVPGTVQQVGTEINKELFDSIEADIETAGNFDPNGTYPNLTAGNATKASQDASGNDIVATYATKEELAAAGQFDPNGTYPNLTAGKATQDGQGRDIASTYALKSETSGKKYAHYLNFGQPNVATKYPEWGVYVGPIIADSGEAFTYQTLFNWLNSRFGPNPAISPRIRGVSASGRYNDYDVYALITKGGRLSFVAWQNNTMRPVIEFMDFDDFEFVDAVVEI